MDSSKQVKCSECGTTTGIGSNLPGAACADVWCEGRLREFKPALNSCGMCPDGCTQKPECGEYKEPTSAQIHYQERLKLMQAEPGDVVEVRNPAEWVQKPSNPKDAIGVTKVPLGIIPPIALAHQALAHLEGALKYGKWNWRIAGVRASVYADALKRHFSKWEDGENMDSKSRVLHLASIAACCNILIDAEHCGKLTDDRPPKAPTSEAIDELGSVVEHLKETFKDHSPRHYTIDD